MDVFSYGILGFSGLLFLYLFLGANSTEVSRVQLKGRIVSNWQRVQVKARSRFNDDSLQELLSSAGLRITPSAYMWFRIALVFLGLLYGIGSYFATGSRVAILLPLLFWAFTSYKSYMPMSTVLGFLAKQHSLQLNKDLYLLYVLIKQELDAYSGHRRSVYDILLDLTPLVPRLKVPLYHCLTIWPKDPGRALERLASDLRTEKAEDLTRILRYIEESRIEVALDILRRIYEAFQADRIAWFRQKIYLRGLVAFSLAFIGIGTVAMDFVKLFSLYTHSLLQVF